MITKGWRKKKKSDSDYFLNMPVDVHQPCGTLPPELQTDRDYIVGELEFDGDHFDHCCGGKCFDVQFQQIFEAINERRFAIAQDLKPFNFTAGEWGQATSWRSWCKLTTGVFRPLKYSDFDDEWYDGAGFIDKLHDYIVQPWIDLTISNDDGSLMKAHFMAVGNIAPLNYWMGCWIKDEFGDDKLRYLDEVRTLWMEAVEKNTPVGFNPFDYGLWTIRPGRGIGGARYFETLTDGFDNYPKIKYKEHINELVSMINVLETVMCKWRRVISKGGSGSAGISGSGCPNARGVICPLIDTAIGNAHQESSRNYEEYTETCDSSGSGGGGILTCDNEEDTFSAGAGGSKNETTVLDKNDSWECYGSWSEVTPCQPAGMNSPGYVKGKSSGNGYAKYSKTFKYKGEWAVPNPS